MSFALYVDEQMTTLAGVAMADGVNVWEHTFDLRKNDDLVLKWFFGSPDVHWQLMTAHNGGQEPIVLSVSDALVSWQPEQYYAVGDVVQPRELSAQGAVYQCVQAGTSGQEPPIWLQTVGAVMQEQSHDAALWKCLGARHRVGALSLSLSGQGDWGQELALGTTVKGGAAVAVYVRLHNDVLTPYWLASVPQLAIEINDCVIVPV